MKITALIENESISTEYITRKALSLHIETGEKKILFDTGEDESFYLNAIKLGVDISKVDMAIISHAHYDHAGGLETFIKNNSDADIYMNEKALGDFYKDCSDGSKKYIGIDKKALDDERLVFVDKQLNIQNLILFGDIVGQELLPKSNKSLLEKLTDGSFVEDPFKHEVNLLINENGKNTLLCGCSHRGIVNIVDKALEITNGEIETVIAGMHLNWADIKKNEDKEFLDILADKLSKFPVKNYYTCHCTGVDTYNYLEQKMNNIKHLKTGMVIEV